MNFNDYQNKAVSFKAGDLSHNEAIAIWALGIAGEAGEVAEHIKKHLGHGHPLDTEEIREELGDVLWYVAVLSNELFIDLNEVAEKNIQKLGQRYPGGFSQDASLNRKSEGAA